MHVDEAIAAVGVGAREEDGVDVADESDMRQALIGVWPRDLEVAGGVVGRERSGWHPIEKKRKAAALTRKNADGVLVSGLDEDLLGQLFGDARPTLVRSRLRCRADPIPLQSGERHRLRFRHSHAW